MRSSVFSRTILLLATGAAQLCAIHGQTNPGSVLRGELRLEGAPRENSVWSIELRNTSGIVTARTTPEGDGRFAFADVPAGEYELSVTGARGNQVARQHVFAQDFTTGVVVAVPANDGSTKTQQGGNTVSLGSLRHQPDRHAVSLLNKAVAAQQRQDYPSSVELLRQALVRDPDWASPHYLLGVELAFHGDVASGARELARAVELDGASADAQGAYAVVLLNLNEAEQARVHAARAVQLDPRSARLRYVLGLSLLQTGRDAEALVHLRQAGAEIARARELASQVANRLDRTGPE